LLQWWTEQNKKDRMVVPGLASAKAAGPWSPDEIIGQISLTRKQAGADGHVHWSMSALRRNSQLITALEKGPYAEPALSPACPWLRRPAPPAPRLTGSSSAGSAVFTFKPVTPDALSLWLVQARTEGHWKTTLVPANRDSVTLTPAPEILSVSAVDRFGNASRPTVVESK